jgi:hypothetical protein
MAEERILTRHPSGKRGVNISKKKYDMIRTSILHCLEKNGLTYEEIVGCVAGEVKDRFEGSLRWYCGAVKLDLEANGLLERIAIGKKTVYRMR